MNVRRELVTSLFVLYTHHGIECLLLEVSTRGRKCPTSHMAISIFTSSGENGGNREGFQFQGVSTIETGGHGGGTTIERGGHPTRCSFHVGIVSVAKFNRMSPSNALSFDTIFGILNWRFI